MFFPFISAVWIAANVNQFYFCILCILSYHENCLIMTTFLTLNFLPWHRGILAEILIGINSLKLMRVEHIDSVFTSSLSIDNHLEIAVLSGAGVGQVSIDDTGMKSIVTFLAKANRIALA
jgi:hypothetical protein